MGEDLELTICFEATEQLQFEEVHHLTHSLSTQSGLTLLSAMFFISKRQV
jgi:hypothetical protein